MRKILIIDDDEEVLETTCEILKMYNYDVHGENNGLQGIESAKKDNFDIILLDEKMPEISGYEVFLKIKEFNKDAKIIMVTAHNDKEKWLKMRKNGALDIIIKPYDINQLIQTIEKFT